MPRALGSKTGSTTAPCATSGTAQLAGSRRSSFSAPSAGTASGRLWDQVEGHLEFLQQNGEFERRRRDQRKHWMWSLIEERLMTTVSPSSDRPINDCRPGGARHGRDRHR